MTKYYRKIVNYWNQKQSF